ncbi:hypothetical protein LJK87_15880 [Paenibacillus sp. P25]|nr:hypothetical protein LJK87_15880 [Paenibacillus sp. P25]
MLRIHDLVTELEDQLEPLSIQSAKAIRFKELKEELKANEIAMYVHQIEQIYENWTETNQRLDKLKREQLELSGFVSRHDAQLEKDRWETRRLEEEIEKLQEHLLVLSEEFEKCEGQGEVLKERKRNFSANRTQLQQTIAQQEQRLTDKEAELAEYRLKIQAIGEELARYQGQLKAEEDRLLGVTGGISGAEEDRLKGELLEALNDMANARNEARYADQRLEALGRRLERLGDEHRKWQEQQAGIAERKQKLESRLQQVVKEIDSARNSYLQVSQGLKGKQSLSEEATATVRKWEQKLQAMVSRRDTMREMANDYDGFMHGVKEVLKAKDRGDLRGIHGAVAELVKVPAQVEVAVETALGGALQHVVVDNEANGREAIAFLKRRQLGRATFLPLDVIRGRSIPDTEQRQIQGMEGFVGIAADLVQYEDKYRQIVGDLLGNVILAESLEVANRIAARVQYRYRVVTLEGDVVNPGGSMTGGEPAEEDDKPSQPAAGRLKKWTRRSPCRKASCAICG